MKKLLLDVARIGIWLTADILLIFLGRLLWNEGAFQLTVDVLTTGHIPQEKQDSISDGMFNELAGWILTVLAAFALTEATRRITKRGIQGEQHSQSAKLLTFNHFALYTTLAKLMSERIKDFPSPIISDHTS